MQTEEFFLFDTVNTITAPALDPDTMAAVKNACLRYEKLFSRFDEQSQLFRINNAHGAPVDVDSELAQFIKTSLAYCEASNGLFDITMGSVTRLWNFKNGTIPAKSDVHSALEHVNWRGVHVTDSTVQLADPDACLELGGIAKGYIADGVLDVLAHHGVEHAIVNLGGNVVTHGVKPNGAKWKIGVQDPKRKDGILGAIQLGNASAVTSGVYERCFERDGTLYHHILDPRTGMPVETDAAGVTVVADASLDAEGFSTTLVALGIKEGAAFVDAHPQIRSAYFVDHHDRVIQVP